MKKYLITFTATGAKLLLAYKDELLLEFQLEGNLDLKRYKAMVEYFPWQIKAVATWKKMPNIKVVEVERDLNFETFWNEYDHKIGNKKRAVTLWSKLSKTNKTAALDFLARYDSQLAVNKGVQKLYPETYLNQQRWNN